MDVYGELTGISRDLSTGKINMSFQVEDLLTQEVNEIKDKRLKITAKPYSKKRSLDANAYYWQLVGKIAKKLKVSAAFLHNRFLRECAVFEEFADGKMFLAMPDTDDARNMIDESMTYHLFPTNQVKTGTKGTPFRTYIMLKGSHAYTTDEMSDLIERMVEVAKELDIETMPPAEIERMVQAWRPNQH